MAAESNPVRDAAGDLSVQTSRISFRLMDTGRSTAVSASYGSFNHAASAAFAIAMMPLRSKLEALLMLLYSRYGHDASVMRQEMKLQALLRLPDSLLAQLDSASDLADSGHHAGCRFLDSNNLSESGLELDKIDISSTTRPDRADRHGQHQRGQSYIVYSPADPAGGREHRVMPTSVVGCTSPSNSRWWSRSRHRPRWPLSRSRRVWETFAAETPAPELSSRRRMSRDVRPGSRAGRTDHGRLHHPRKRRAGGARRAVLTSAAASEGAHPLSATGLRGHRGPATIRSGRTRSRDGPGEPFSSPGDAGVARVRTTRPPWRRYDAAPADETERRDAQ